MVQHVSVSELQTKHSPMLTKMQLPGVWLEKLNIQSRDSLTLEQIQAAADETALGLSL